MLIPSKLRIGLCIPTRNAGDDAYRQVAAIGSQTIKPDRFLVIDSSSSDGSVQAYAEAGADVHTIRPAEFNHGATRQLGVELLDTDVVVFLTQDAVFAEPESLRRLVATFANASVGVAYGRQLPKPGASAIATHARLFNYPEKGRDRSLEDRVELGIKTVFLSNSFAAYRSSELRRVGGFPAGLIMGEDMYIAGKILLSGGMVSYCAEATVFHSHDYTWAEEFRRYFDTGVLHAREAWILEQFGGPGGEGWRFLKSEMRYLLRRNPLLLPSALVRTSLKLFGFRLGLQERNIPLGLKRRLSMFRCFWRP